MVKYIFCCQSIKYWSEETCQPHKPKSLAKQTFTMTLSKIALGLCISWVIEINFVKNRQLVITMVKYIFAVEASNTGENKPVTHTKPSHWLSKHSQ